jgi:thioredoxin reductase
MLKAAREKLAVYPSVRFIDSEAMEAEADDGGFAIRLADGHRLETRKLVLAFGLKDSLPEIPGIQERWGKTVLHCPYCHGFEFLSQPLGVLSVLPHSAHQAQLIPEWGPTTFFLNGAAMPDEETYARLAARQVTIEAAPIAGLEGEAPDLQGVRLADGRLVTVAALYLAPRTSFQSPIAGQLGCALEDGPTGPVIKTDPMKRTSVAGVFAAGDITRPMHNATLASADGVMAGGAVHQSLVFG